MLEFVPVPLDGLLGAFHNTVDLLERPAMSVAGERPCDFIRQQLSGKEGKHIADGDHGVEP